VSLARGLNSLPAFLVAPLSVRNRNLETSTESDYSNPSLASTAMERRSSLRLRKPDGTTYTRRYGTSFPRHTFSRLTLPTPTAQLADLHRLAGETTARIYT